MTVFLAIFGLILDMFLTSQPNEFDEITHKGPKFNVEGLYESSFESYEQFLRKLKKVEKWLFLGFFWPFLG